MKGMTLEAVAKACGGIYHGSDGNKIKEVSAITTDSRQIQPQGMFIAIKGARSDGHAYIDSCYEKGALCCISEQELPGEKRPYIQVESSLQALKDIAQLYRANLDIKVVGITGSVGKTSTKETIAAVLSQKYKVLKTQGNFNNEIGLPITIFGLEKEHEAAVLEMGMNHFGEIEHLADIGRPDVAVITNIGQSHIENLGSREGIFKAKMEMTKLFTKDNTLIVNGDDDYLSKTKGMGEYKVVYYGITNPENDVYAKDIENNGLNGIKFTAVVDGGEYPIEVNIPGKHNVYNALAAICVGREFDVPMDKIAEGIRSFELTKMRLAVEEYNGITIINDCYNASPDSIKAALGVLADTDKNRKVAILGDVLEMGDFAKDAHYNLGKAVKENGVDLLITAGENMKYLAQGAKDNGVENIVSFDKTLEVCNYVKDEIKSGDAVLIKASRGMHFEEVYDFFYDDYNYLADFSFG